jgi:eukaryotic-like serine/threonine-protein kinase
VKLLGAEVELPPARAATADELLRVDVAHAAAAGLVPVDPLRGLMFQSRYLLLALEAGEPHRIGRAIALEAATCIIDGNINAERARALSRRAMLMGERLGDPRIVATALLAEGVIHLFEGQFRPSISFFEKAEALARERCRGMAAAVFNCACLRLWGLRLVGDMQGLRAGIPRLLDDAMRRGDVATQANVRGESLYCLHLADDRPDAAARELETMNETWTGEGYDSVRYWFLRGSVEVALYEGRFADAWSLVERAWPRLRFSSAFAVQAVRVEALEIRARAALALAQVQKGSERFALRRIARDAATRMERENIAWGNTLAELHLCALDMHEGASAELLRRLEAVSAFFQEREMRFHECAARERLGRLKGRTGTSYGAMAGCGVKEPERMLRVIAPE